MIEVRPAVMVSKAREKNRCIGSSPLVLVKHVVRRPRGCPSARSRWGAHGNLPPIRGRLENGSRIMNDAMRWSGPRSGKHLRATWVKSRGAHDPTDSKPRGGDHGSRLRDAARQTWTGPVWTSAKLYRARRGGWKIKEGVEARRAAESSGLMSWDCMESVPSDSAIHAQDSANPGNRRIGVAEGEGADFPEH